jgi:hypothetical protein
VALGGAGDELRLFFVRSGPQRGPSGSGKEGDDFDPGKPDPAIWRLVLNGVGKLTEIEHEWSFQDLLDGNDMLTLKQQRENEANNRGVA